MIKGLKLDKELLYEERGMEAYKREVDKFDSITPSCRLRDLIGEYEIRELYRICNDSSLQCNINKKFDLMKKLLNPLGFVRFTNGTNRVCFKHVNHPDILLKIAIDSVGLRDSLSEYNVQNIFKPYVCKIFEVHPTGVVALVETVQPIRRHEQLALVADEMYDVLNRFFGASKYLMEDIGEQYFLNWGIRKDFGLVLLDYPYLFKIDKNRSHCIHRDLYTGEICGGEIDYDAGFNHLYCKKCGKEYKVKEIAIKMDTANLERGNIPMYRDNDFDEFKPSIVYITDENGKIKYPGNLSNFNINPKDIENGIVDNSGNIKDTNIEKEEPSKEPKPMSKRHMAMILLDDLKDHGVEIPEEYLNKIRSLYNIPLEKEEEKLSIEDNTTKKHSLFSIVKDDEKEDLKLSGTPLQDEPLEIEAEIKEEVPSKEEIRKASETVSDMFSNYTYEVSAKQGDVLDTEKEDNNMSLASSLGLPKTQKVKGIPEKYLVSEEDKDTYQQMSGEDFIELMFSLFDEKVNAYINSEGPGNLMNNYNGLFEDMLIDMEQTLGQYMVSNDVEFKDEDEVREKASVSVKEYFKTKNIVNKFKALDKEVIDAELQDKDRSTNKKNKRKFRK